MVLRNRDLNYVQIKRLYGANMAICGIYKITEKSTNKSYIGQSIDIANRIEQHQHDNTPGWHQIFNKNPNNFNIEILEQCLPTELDEKEKYYINKFDSYNNGFNLTRGNGDKIDTKEINYFYISPFFTLQDVNKITTVLLTNSFKNTLDNIIKINNLTYDKIAYWLDFKCSNYCFIVKVLFKINKEFINKNTTHIFLDLIPRKDFKILEEDEEQNIKNIWFKYCNEVDYYFAPYKKLYHIKNTFGYKCQKFYYMNNINTENPLNKISTNVLIVN